MEDPHRLADWRICVSLKLPHPDFLYTLLNAEQLFELRLYHAKESFGEMRADLRMAHMLRFYYDMKRGKKGQKLSLGELTLYADLIEASGTKDLQLFLGGMGAKPEKKGVKRGR